MQYLNGEYYVGVKYHRYRIHPTEKIYLRKRDPPTFSRIQYQFQNETQIRKNQKFVKNNKIEIIVRINLKRNKRCNHNQNLNHQIVLTVNKTIV